MPTLRSHLRLPISTPHPRRGAAGYIKMLPIFHPQQHRSPGAAIPGAPTKIGHFPIAPIVIEDTHADVRLPVQCVSDAL